MNSSQEILHIIMQKISEINMTAKDCLIACEINTSFLTDWKNGKLKNPSFDKIVRIAEYLNIDINYLFTGKEKSPAEAEQGEKLSKNEQELLELYQKLSAEDRVKVTERAQTLYDLASEQQESNTCLIPLYYIDDRVSAGLCEMLSDYEQGKTIYVPETPESRRADFVLRVSCDSMEPRFYDGDYVLVRSQPVIDIGQIGIFGLDGSGYIKKLGKNSLISLNTRYKPIPITENTVCFGVVLGTTEIIK